MKRTFDALVWICVGIQAAMVGVMLIFEDVLADVPMSIGATRASEMRTDFFDWHGWSLIALAAVSFIDMAMRYRARQSGHVHD